MPRSSTTSFMTTWGRKGNVGGGEDDGGVMRGRVRFKLHRPSTTALRITWEPPMVSVTVVSDFVRCDEGL